MINDKLLETEWSPKFLTLVENKLGYELDSYFVEYAQKSMIMGYYTYGPLKKDYPNRCTGIGSLAIRLTKYIEAVNPEYLVDSYNFTMIEYMYSTSKSKCKEVRLSDGLPSIIDTGIRQYIESHDRCDLVEIACAIYNEYEKCIAQGLCIKPTESGESPGLDRLSTNESQRFKEGHS